MNLQGDTEMAHENASQRESIPYLKLILQQGYVTSSVIKYNYAGSGTADDPYIVEWIVNDPRNPMLVSDARKWLWTVLESLTTFAVAITTSGYSAAPVQVDERFHPSNEVYELGFSLFVLGFALGPLFWCVYSIERL
jgi:hypothetical protein